MSDQDDLDTVLRPLREQLQAAEQRVAKLRRAIVSVEEVWQPVSAPNGRSLASAVIAPAEPAARPQLRDAIPFVMRDFPEKEWDVHAMATELWHRKWLGGKNGTPSVESLRPVMNHLRNEGVLTSRVDPVIKRTVYRLSNVPLSRPTT